MLALALDFGGPYFFGVEGWQLVPGHFAERHGLIIIIALGESIVEIGAGAAGHLDLGIGVAAVLGVAVAAAMWWVYFDVVALVSAKRLAEAEQGREQNALARDSYSYIHLFLVAGIVLAAFGLKTVIAHTDAAPRLGDGVRAARRDRALPARPGRLPLPPQTHLEPQQTDHSRPYCSPWSRSRRTIPALASVAIATGLLAVLVAFEHRGYDERRDQPAGAQHDDRGGGARWLRNPKWCSLTDRKSNGESDFGILRRL